MHNYYNNKLLFFYQTGSSLPLVGHCCFWLRHREDVSKTKWRLRLDPTHPSHHRYHRANLDSGSTHDDDLQTLPRHPEGYFYRFQLQKMVLWMDIFGMDIVEELHHYRWEYSDFLGAPSHAHLASAL